jgi:curved DNA-binding protein CbpA
MSSASAGKFQDHYALLSIETNADTETIQAAYSKLAQKFHPSNDATGDKVKFDAVNLAFEVLSDPGLRASFDKVKGVDHEAGNPKFTGSGFFTALAQGSAMRAAVLCILYDRRRIKPFKPGLSMRHLEGMMISSGDELSFAVWYLKQRSLIISDDKSNMEITVEGMDYLEKSQPEPAALIPFIKEDAFVNAAPPQPEKVAVVEVVEVKPAEPVLNILNRALNRGGLEEAPRRQPVRLTFP